MAQIVFIDGVRMGASLPLGTRTTLGGDASNAVVLDGEGVAARHAVISLLGGVFRLAAATPGARITVNGRQAGDEPLRHGDILAFGERTLLFSDEASTLPPALLEPPAPDPKQGRSIIESRLKQPADPGAVLEALRKHDKLAAHLETLYRTAATVNSTLRLDDLVKGLIDSLFSVFAADRAFILLRDERGELRVAGQRVSEASERRGFVDVSHTIINEAIARREGILTRDASADTRFADGLSIVEQNIQSAMCSPIVTQDRILGAIHVDTLDAARAYATQDLQLLGGIAAQTALAIENVLSHERAIERARKLIGLGDTSRRISSFLSTPVIVREAVESAARIFDSEKVSLLMAEESGRLKVSFATHLNTAFRQNASIAPGEGIAGAVFMENVPRRLSEVSTDGRAYATTSCMLAPVVARRGALGGESRPVGVLCVADRRSRRPFDEEDLELLSILAAQVGVSLQNARLFEKATVDGLTQLFTRQYFFARLEEEIESHRRQGAPLTVVMLDLDEFKRKNDAFGHAAGDAILAGVARRFRERILRAGGMAGRYGGEEFVALLPGRSASSAHAVAEELRAAIEAAPFEHDGHPHSCTASLGLAQLGEGEGPDALVRRADAALYQAKNAGRNRTVVAGS